jgi:hypothetical protein
MIFAFQFLPDVAAGFRTLAAHPNQQIAAIKTLRRMRPYGFLQKSCARIEPAKKASSQLGEWLLSISR